MSQNLESTAAADWFEELLTENQAVVADDGLRALREPARARLSALPRPHRKQEAWRYTQLGRLFDQVYALTPASVVEASELDCGEYLWSAEDSYRVVFCNHKLIKQLSHLPEPESGLSLQTLDQLDAVQLKLVLDQLQGLEAFADDVFDNLNRALLSSGWYLRVAANVVVDKPLEIVFVHDSKQANSMLQQRALVVLESGAELQLLERHFSPAASANWSSSLTRVQLHDNAGLQHYLLQQGTSKSQFLHRQVLQQDQHSRFNSIQLALNSDWCRNDLQIDLQGQGAETRLNGLYLVGEQQYNDAHVEVRHLQPHCHSEVNYQGLLQGKGRAVFDGNIYVARDAQKTAAHLSNRNLILVEGAQVDSKPQLEIYADDVQCSHGTTVGGIEPEQLRYCQSRGLSRQRAMSLLAQAFAHQVVSMQREAPIRDYLQRQITAALEA